MIDVDRNLLHSSLPHRIDFARRFIQFSDDDAEVLNAAAPLVAPLVQGVVDGVYSHLFDFSYTKQSFLPANTGFEGDRPKDLASLTLDDPQIAFRKKFLTTWATKLFTADYREQSTWEYFDRVGLMHTGVAGFKHREKKAPLFVDLLACSLLLGWVETVLVNAVLPIDDDTLSLEMKTKVLTAVNKVLWIQQDLFQRHYIRTDEEFAAFHAKQNGSAPEPSPVDTSLASVLASPFAFPFGLLLGALVIRFLL